MLFKPNVPPLISNVFILLMIGATAYLAVLLFLTFSKGAAESLTKFYFKINKIIRPSKCTTTNIEKTKQSLASFYEGFKTFREKPKLLIRPFILHASAYILGLSVFILVFYALGIPAASPGFYIAVYFIATGFQDAAASLSVGSLDILLATIFILYGLNSGVSSVAALILRSALFWFPLLAGFVSVQYMGAKNLIGIKPKDTRKSLEERKISDKPFILANQQNPNTCDTPNTKVFKMAAEDKKHESSD